MLCWLAIDYTLFSKKSSNFCPMSWGTPPTSTQLPEFPKNLGAPFCKTPANSGQSHPLPFEDPTYEHHLHMNPDTRSSWMFVLNTQRHPAQRRCGLWWSNDAIFFGGKENRRVVGESWLAANCSCFVFCLIYESILPRIEIVAADWKINRYFFGSRVHLPVNKLGVDWNVGLWMFTCFQYVS